MLPAGQFKEQLTPAEVATRRDDDHHRESPQPRLTLAPKTDSIRGRIAFGRCEGIEHLFEYATASGTQRMKPSAKNDAVDSRIASTGLCDHTRREGQRGFVGVLRRGSGIVIDDHSDLQRRRIAVLSNVGLTAPRPSFRVEVANGVAAPVGTHRKKLERLAGADRTLWCSGGATDARHEVEARELRYRRDNQETHGVTANARANSEPTGDEPRRREDVELMLATRDETGASLNARASALGNHRD